MYSRYQGTCTLQRRCWPQQVVVHDLIQEGPHASNIVFSECQALEGLRFLGRQLGAKTSFPIVTGLELGEHEQKQGHSGSVRPAGKEWGI